MRNIAPFRYLMRNISPQIRGGGALKLEIRVFARISWGNFNANPLWICPWKHTSTYVHLVDQEDGQQAIHLGKHFHTRLVSEKHFS